VVVALGTSVNLTTPQRAALRWLVGWDHTGYPADRTLIALVRKGMAKRTLQSGGRAGRGFMITQAGKNYLLPPVGRCAVCTFTSKLVAAGTMRRHRTFGQLCPGVGQAPATQKAHW
jgi:hypothetical protein